MITKNNDMSVLKDSFLKQIALFLLDKKQLEYTTQTGTGIYEDSSFLARISHHELDNGI
jgi:hypothetical protein